MKSVMSFVKRSESIYSGELLDIIYSNYEEMPKGLRKEIPKSKDEEALQKLIEYMTKQKNVEVIPNDRLDQYIIKYVKKETKKIKPVGEFVDFLKKIRKFSKAEVFDLTEISWEDKIRETIEDLKDEIYEIVATNDLKEVEKLNLLGDAFQLIVFIESEDKDDKIEFLKELCENYDIIFTNKIKPINNIFNEEQNYEEVKGV